MHYTILPRPASRPKANSNFIDPDRARFARLITLAEFDHRAGKALDQGEFRDRRPDAPQRFANGRMVP